MNMTTADAALKNFYLDPVRAQINNKNVLLEYCSKGKVDTEGRYAVLSLHTRRNSSVGARSDGNDLPGTYSGGTDIGNQGYAEQRVPLKQMFGRIQVDERVLKAARTNRGAFINVMSAETEGLAEDMKKDLNRQLFGDASGIIVGVGTDAGGDTDVPLHSTDATPVHWRQLEVGMKVDIGTTADVDAIVEYAEIVAVDFSSLPGTLTFDQNIGATTEDTHYIFRAGVGAGGAAADVEVEGLQSIIAATGALFNVDPATEPRWASYVRDLSGGPINDTDLILAAQRIGYESGGQPDVGITSGGILRSYSASLSPQKRFDKTLELKGGFSGLAVGHGNGQFALTDDRDCPTGNVFLVKTKNLAMHVAGDWEWMDLDGAIWSRQANKARYEATLFRFHELSTDRRNCLGRLSNVDDPDATTV